MKRSTFGKSLDGYGEHLIRREDWFFKPWNTERVNELRQRP